MENAFHFSDHEREIVSKLGATILPAVNNLPPFEHDAITRVENKVANLPLGMQKGLKAMIHILDKAAYARYLRPMSKLSEQKRYNYLKYLTQSGYPQRTSFRLLGMFIKMGYYDNPSIFQDLNVEYKKPDVSEEPERWKSQILEGKAIDDRLDLEAEVVVIGTGAGGAVVASELAEKGNAVVLIEQGEYHDRAQFSGRPDEMQQMMYRDRGMAFTVGNTGIALLSGITVGGTTTINSGTCFRTPNRVLRRWREEYGLTDMTPKNLDPYFTRVENIYQVTTAEMKYVGKNGEKLAKGADILGYSHGPLPRNAPDCDGQGVCPFGCPTGAKRSTNVSYVPRALSSSAYMITGTKIDKIITENGVAVGVQGRSLSTNQRVSVRAKVVVVAGGTLASPMLLRKNNLGNRSGQLGKNISIHPAAGTFAIMDEPLNAWKSIPQGYMIDEFKEEDIVLENVHFPMDLFASVLPGLGKDYQEVLEKYNNISTLGCMLMDSSRGSVRPWLNGSPLMMYNLNEQDTNKLIRGVAIACRIYLAAGAKKVIPPIHGWSPIYCEKDIESNLKRTVKTRDLDLSAYHPLGSCHMGDDPDKYVCNQYGEVHDTENLFVCDGSTVPPALGVNPMITISALATRSADYISDRLSKISEV